MQQVAAGLASARFVDMSLHNDQLLDFVTAASAKTGPPPATGWTLVRFDSHSDLFGFQDPNL